MSSAWLPIVVRVLCFAAMVRLVWVLIGYYVLERSERHHLETAWMIFISVAIVAAACLPAARRTVALPSRAVAGPALLVACIAASLLLYYRSLDVGLLSDDFVLLGLSPVGTEWQFFRPLPLTVWSIVYPLAGPAGFHALNTTLHGINAFLVYRLCTMLLAGASRVQCAAAAAVFLTFPAAVEPVSWAAGVFDVALVTATLTYLNALLARKESPNVVALLALAAALLCKETAVVVPVVGWSLLLVAPVHKGTLLWSTGMAAAFAVTRMFFTEAPEITAPLGYFLKEMASRPFATLGTPFTSNELLQSPMVFGVVPQLLIAALVAIYLVHVRHGVRPLLPATWVLLGVAPLLSYFFISDTLQGSRYLYLPLVGWSIVIAQLSDGGDNRRLRWVGTLLVALIVGYGVVGTIRHQVPWSAAAATRDAVLLEAQRAMAEQRCGAAAFADIPDSVDGAYVFRNGFAEAAQLVGIRVAASGAAPPDCAFAWRDGSFVATSADFDPRTK